MQQTLTTQCQACFLLLPQRQRTHALWQGAVLWHVLLQALGPGMPVLAQARVQVQVQVQVPQQWWWQSVSQQVLCHLSEWRPSRRWTWQARVQAQAQAQGRERRPQVPARVPAQRAERGSPGKTSSTVFFRCAPMQETSGKRERLVHAQAQVLGSERERGLGQRQACWWQQRRDVRRQTKKTGVTLVLGVGGVLGLGRASWQACRHLQPSAVSSQRRARVTARAQQATVKRQLTRSGNA